MQSTSAHGADDPSATKPIAWIFLALLCWALLGFAQPARAADAVANLASFVQQIGAAQPQAGSVQTVSVKESQNPHQQSQDPHQQVDTEVFAALRAYAQRIGADQPTTLSAPQLKVAEAGSLLEFLQQREAQPSSKPGATTAPARTAAPRRERAVIDASYVGQKVCMTCHASHAAEFGKTLMGRIASTKQTMNCETCHGPGSAHVKAGGGRGVGGIISFRKEDLSRTSAENNAICLGCHEKGDRTYWSGSTHENRDVACTNCHTVMKNVSLKKQLKTAFEPETCFQCHKDRRAQMARSSHMPIREGKITCTNCHNPHGSFTEALLRKNSINDTCYGCHAEKRGPFLFEHTPVRENCTNCHDPHGTANEYSLKLSRQRLCMECHTIGHGLPSGPQAVQSIGRQCQNCHTAIHGTNSPSGALLHR